MRHAAISTLASILLAGCAQISPHLIVDGQSKSVTSAEFASLMVAARRWIYAMPSIPPHGPIYRVYFISPTHAQVWYGDSNSNSRSYGYFKRTKEGWQNAGAGSWTRLKT
jgi:hypothetical protein